MPKTREGLARLVEREGVSPHVVDAYRHVDRRDFVPERSAHRAYDDRPIGLPDQQTTSQPTLIAHMVDALDLRPEDEVLEVGTGYGFQTAVVAALTGKVTSIERHDDLAARARRNLEAAGVTNATVIVGDGWKGVPDAAPFDAIIVSAAATEVPVALEDQLGEGGRMVIPLRSAQGDPVYRFDKREGVLRRGKLLTPALFVPLVPGTPT